MRKKESIVALLAVITLGSGCFSKTMIYSKPSGAKVTIDNARLLGTTPIELDEQVWIWTKHQVRVEAEGFEAKTVQIRSTGVNLGYAVICLCTLGLLLPLGLASDYPKQYVVELAPSGAQPAAPQASLQNRTTVSFK